MKSFVALAILVTAICVCVSASAATWYVDGSVVSGGDGKSWETAFRTIQGGVNAAGEGDTVIVAEGTYVANILFKGPNIVLQSRDPFNSNIVRNTIIDGNQTSSVVTFTGAEDETCLLTGFTIRNGKGRDSGRYGGGIYGGGTRAAIRHNMITLNRLTST
jgi:hypothetical protein